MFNRRKQSQLALAVIALRTRNVTERVVASRNLLPSFPYRLGDNIVRGGGSSSRTSRGGGIVRQRIR